MTLDKREACSECNGLGFGPFGGCGECCGSGQASWQRTQSAGAGAVECMHFEYRHPDSGERRTVTITRQDVADGMEDTLFEKLCEQICRCEPVGETNVVECNCSDYTDDFQLLDAAPAQPVAQGYVIVPVDPTPKMLVAYMETDGAVKRWKAMVAAAKAEGVHV